MTWSLGETRALAIKATRGSGMSWGMAEEAGFAVEWLQARGAPGVEALAALLDEQRAEPPNIEICPLHLGARIMDGGRDLPTGKFVAQQPLLLLPFLATVHAPNALSLQFGRVGINFSHLGLSSTAPYSRALIQQADCLVSDGEMRTDVTCQTRVPDSAELAMRRLAIHAHKTYAPATEQSRLAGAGAGTTDND